MPGHRNKRLCVLEITKNVLFLYSNYKIIKQEINKMAIYLTMLFSDLVTPCSLYRIKRLSGLAMMTSLISFMVNSALVNRARFR